jgi:hypothetical protein
MQVSRCADARCGRVTTWMVSAVGKMGKSKQLLNPLLESDYDI